MICPLCSWYVDGERSLGCVHNIKRPYRLALPEQNLPSHPQPCIPSTSPQDCGGDRSMARLCTPNVSVDYDDSVDQSFDTTFPSASTSMSWTNTWPELQVRARRRPCQQQPRRARLSPSYALLVFLFHNSHPPLCLFNRFWISTATTSSVSTAVSTPVQR